MYELIAVVVCPGELSSKALEVKGSTFFSLALLVSCVRSVSNLFFRLL